MAGIKLIDVCKTFDKKTNVVDHFDMDIKDKEFIVLVGPSGCGKSTMLRMIAGLEEISAGEIFIGNIKVNEVLPRDRNIAMVFQNYALYPHMTVFQNMAFSLKLQKMPKDVINSRVLRAAKILDIVDYLERKPKSLSGGQRQRVAIGRAIVRQPQVFLMDEPLSNLDAKLRNQMRAELIKLHERVDTTFIYVTHDQVEAMTLGNRIVIMKDGTIQQIGTPSEVFRQPANQFVAGFIGTPQMNFIEKVKLVKDGGGHVLNLFGKKYALPLAKQNKLTGLGCLPSYVTVGIRSEHIKLNNDAGAFSGMVEVVEMMGSEEYLHIRMEDNTQLLIKITVSADASIRHGEKINFSMNADDMHLFDSESGTRLC